MLMKQNVNNDIMKDSPIVSKNQYLNNVYINFIDSNFMSF